MNRSRICTHGLLLAQCEACTRYEGECDLGGCIRPATYYARWYSEEGELAQQRPICEQDIQFARDLGGAVYERMRPVHGNWVRAVVYLDRNGQFDKLMDSHLTHSEDDLAATGWERYHDEWVRAL